jgi:hypothetical protein
VSEPREDEILAWEVATAVFINTIGTVKPNYSVAMTMSEWKCLTVDAIMEFRARTWKPPAAFDAEKLARRVADMDYADGDSLGLKFGGDGDSGEILIELLAKAAAGGAEKDDSMSNEGEWGYEDWDQPRGDERVTTFTKEQLEYWAQTQPLAAFALSLMERAEAAERDRDLAIAHDRQPYPTAEAYELACAAVEKHRKRAKNAEAERDEARRELAEWRKGQKEGRW